MFYCYFGSNNRYYVSVMTYILPFTAYMYCQSLDYVKISYFALNIYSSKEEVKCSDYIV